MGDSKLTALPEVTSPDATDLLYIVDDVGGTPTSKKIEFGRLGQYINVKNYGATGDGVTDETVAFQAAEDAVLAAGAGTIFVPAGSYVKGRTFPPDNTTYIFDAAAIMIQKAAASNIWRVRNDNVHFFCNGALWDGSTVGATSHVFQFEGCRNCSIHECNISGSASGKDGLNITGIIAPEASNVRVLGGKILNSGRNGISVVFATGVVIDGVEISGAVTAPGAGIDVEANNFDAVDDITIQNCWVHDNGGVGIVSVFGTGVRILNNRCTGNTSHGIAVGAGGAQFEPSVARARDLRGVSDFATATGKITASNVSDADGDGLPIGTLVQFPVTGSGALPAELQAQTRWVVTSVDTVGNTFTVGESVDYGELTTFSDGGAGTQDLDPSVSEVTCLSYVAGQASDCLVEGNICSGNGNGKEISMALCVNVVVRDNIVRPVAGQTGISFSFTRDSLCDGNLVTYVRDNAGLDTGINFGTCTNIKSINNVVKYSGGSGYRFSACSHANAIGDYSYGCAHNVSFCYRCDASPFSRLTNIMVRTDDHTGEASGIRCDANSDSIIVSHCDVMGTGVSNASSLVLSGSNIVSTNNILWDGTIG